MTPADRQSMPPINLLPAAVDLKIAIVYAGLNEAIPVTAAQRLISALGLRSA